MKRTAVGVVAAVLAAAVLALFAILATTRVERADDPPSAGSRRGVVASTAAPAPDEAPAPVERPRATPSTPRYRATPVEAPLRAQSPGPDAIFRCRTASGIRYSDAPCPGGIVVDGSSAVGGFDSRPSDRLARLVADGRANAGVAAAGPPRVARSFGAAESTICATLRRQIDDLDAAALAPNSLRRLDELRAVRQDVRTTMAREHC